MSRLRHAPTVLVLGIIILSAGPGVKAPPALRVARTGARFSAPSTSRSGYVMEQAGPVPSETSSDGAFSWSSRAVSNISNFGEPSIDVDHDNNVYITAPGGAGVQLWKSKDLGRTFDYVEVGSDAGGGDSEIEFNLNDVAFTADLEVQDSAISRSTDGFKTFEQQDVGVEQDRQWLAHQCAKTIYLVYHDFAAELELLNRSDDAGKTWSTDPVAVGNPGDAPGGQDEPVIADQGGNTFSGPIAVNQKNGDVFVVYAISTAEGNVTTGTPPYGDPEQVVVATSHDKGQTFELHLVQGGEPGTLAGVIFPWITIDKAGNVYVSWAGRQSEDEPLNIYMTWSKNGDNWAEPYRVNRDVGGAHIYSTISAGDEGVVDVAWYTANKPLPDAPEADWFVDFAQVHNANSNNPQISQSRVYQQPIHHGDICLQGLLCILGGDRSLLDFFQIQVGKDGMANIAFANNGSPDTIQRVWYARQTDGPSAGNALHDMQFCGGGGGGGNEGPTLPGPHVRMHVSDKTPARGEGITFFTRLAVCTKSHRGTKMELAEEAKGRYNTIATKKLNKRCRARFTIPATFTRATFKAFWPKQDDDHRRGRSKPKTVVTH